MEELRYKERIRLKEKRILMDYKRTIIEKENLHIQNMVEDGRIKKVNISGLFRVQKLFFYVQLQEGILARRTSRK